MLISLALVLLVAVPVAILPAIAKRQSWSAGEKVENTARASIALGLAAILVGIIWVLTSTARWWSVTAFAGGTFWVIGGLRDLRKAAGRKP